MSRSSRKVPATDLQAGMSLVEVTIGATLLVALLGMTYGSVISIQSANRYGEAKNRQLATARNVTERIHSELEECSMDRDPRTGQRRYRIVPDAANGRDTLTFQKLVGVEQNGSEIRPVWSSDITITTDAEGTVSRSQDGERRILGTDVHRLQFAVTPRSEFQVVLTTLFRRPDSGEIDIERRQISIKPKH